MTAVAALFAVQPYLAGLGALLAAGWVALSLGLGRAREQRAAQQAALEPKAG